MGLRVIAGCLTEKATEELKRQTKHNLKTVLIDVTKLDSIKEAMEYVKKEVHPTGLWALVNNAGILGPLNFVESLSHQDYRDVAAVNLFGLIDTTKVFLPLIRKAKGRIVNMSSMAGKFGSTWFSAYDATKFGVEGFSDALRREIYKFGVTVHLIEPGFYGTNIIDTDKLVGPTRKAFDSASVEVQHAYGRDYMEAIISKDVLGTIKKLTSPHTDVVVDAQIHAVTARYPKIRYFVGYMSFIGLNFINRLPDWMVDQLMILLSKSKNDFIHPDDR